MSMSIFQTPTIDTHINVCDQVLVWSILQLRWARKMANFNQKRTLPFQLKYTGRQSQPELVQNSTQCRNRCPEQWTRVEGRVLELQFVCTADTFCWWLYRIGEPPYRTISYAFIIVGHNEETLISNFWISQYFKVCRGLPSVVNTSNWLLNQLFQLQYENFPYL